MLYGREGNRDDEKRGKRCGEIGGRKTVGKKRGKREKEREKQVADDVMRNRRAVCEERANSGKTDAPQIRPRISELEAPESSVAEAVEIKSSGSSKMCVWKERP